MHTCCDTGFRERCVIRYYMITEGVFAHNVQYLLSINDDVNYNCYCCRFVWSVSMFSNDASRVSDGDAR